MKSLINSWKKKLNDQNLRNIYTYSWWKYSLSRKKSDFKVLRKKITAQKEGKTIDKSDDPIRMYLREMGGETSSREEIAIAKRIEAGKDVMLNHLGTESDYSPAIFRLER